MEAARIHGWIVQKDLQSYSLSVFFWKNIVGSGDGFKVKTSLYLALRRSQQISSCLFGKMWFLVGLPNFHPCWCWLFRWGGGIVWTLNSMWPFFSQQKLLENLQSIWVNYDHSMHFKDSNTNQVDFPHLNNTNLWDGVFFVVFRRPTKG